MKTMEKLIAFYESHKNERTKAVIIGPWKSKKIGNHRVEFFADGTAKFIYYSTPICIIDEYKNVTITNGGWGTISTTQACNSYSRQLKALGYNVTDTRNK